MFLLSLRAFEKHGKKIWRNFCSQTVTILCRFGSRLFGGGHVWLRLWKLELSSRPKSACGAKRMWNLPGWEAIRPCYSRRGLCSEKKLFLRIPIWTQLLQQRTCRMSILQKYRSYCSAMRWFNARVHQSLWLSQFIFEFVPATWSDKGIRQKIQCHDKNLVPKKSLFVCKIWTLCPMKILPAYPLTRWLDHRCSLPKNQIRTANCDDCPPRRRYCYRGLVEWALLARAEATTKFGDLKCCHKTIFEAPRKPRVRWSNRQGCTYLTWWRVKTKHAHDTNQRSWHLFWNASTQHVFRLTCPRSLCSRKMWTFDETWRITGVVRWIPSTHCTLHTTSITILRRETIRILTWHENELDVILMDSLRLTSVDEQPGRLLPQTQELLQQHSRHHTRRFMNYVTNCWWKLLRNYWNLLTLLDMKIADLCSKASHTWQTWQGWQKTFENKKSSLALPCFASSASLLLLSFVESERKQKQ